MLRLLFIEIKITATQKFSCHKSGAYLIRMNSVPCNKGGMADAAIIRIHLLEGNQFALVFVSKHFAYLDLLIHPCAHSILLIGLHIIRSKDKNALNVIFDS